MSLRSTISAFDTWRWAGQSVVLVTVVSTEGSTYSKAGHRMVIAENGDYHGLVSGGCLEGDLALHAREVFADGKARLLTYDLRDEADEIWGLGIGCNGLLRLLLQRLDPASHYAPFLAIRESHRSLDGGRLALVIASSHAETPLGAALITGTSGEDNWSMPPALLAAARDGLADITLPQNLKLSCADGDYELLCAAIAPIPRLLILGAGPDAVPLLHLAREMGWEITVADHRPAYLESPGLETADHRFEVRPGQLAAQLQPAEFHAAVVMSHHLETDRAHLAELAREGPDYVGLLGPPARRDRLLAELGDQAGDLATRLRGPVGLGIGADSPESIALAIVAEIQQYLAAAPAPLDSAE